MKKGLIIYEYDIDKIDMLVSGVSLVKEPAIAKDFDYYSKNKIEDDNIKFQINFSVINMAQRIVEGPVMVPSFIYRDNIPPTNKKGYVYFTKKTIESLMHRFESLPNKYLTIDHKSILNENDYTILDNYMKDGKWYMKVKINNNSIWSKITEGVWRGFSIELQILK